RGAGRATRRRIPPGAARRGARRRHRPLLRGRRPAAARDRARSRGSRTRVTRSRILASAGLVVLAVGVAWVLFIGLPRWKSHPQTTLPEDSATPSAAAPAAPVPAEAP